MKVLTVEKLVPGGYGLARSEEGVVLVKGGLPGEAVRGRPVRRKGALFLEGVEVLSPRGDRYPHPLPPPPTCPSGTKPSFPSRKAWWPRP